MIEFIRSDQLACDPRPALGLIMAEGFMRHLSFFTTDEAKLGRAFEHSFVLEHFHVALIDGEIAAFVGCSDRSAPIIRLQRKDLCKHLGLIKGIIAYIFVRKQMIEKPYPFTLPKNTGSIDFVAASKKHRGKGATKLLMQYVMKQCGYKDYVLEVVDNNPNAIGLYEKLGFKEFKRVKEKHAEQAGFDYYIYMTTGDATSIQ